ncbi:uncharacterized protein KIAA1958 homolog isoform X2 [Dreissena polymorpha]|uniref:uncharacterized protein KIAA1958 homolog isoform X2 n=1 Tax=Dreissena polymorpha TaxID=45954 RepID=UPI0022652806|nr:uncharacterized protein KIAA1958 homolog isoform X2 [Dreissena polymorpha]
MTFFNEMNEQDDDSASKSQEITPAAPTAGAATSAPPPLVTASTQEEKEQNPTSTPTRNFRSVSLDSFLLENENLNTKKKTDNDIRLFKTFLKSHKNEARNIENIPPHELNPLVCEFLLGVTKKDGSEYEPTSLRAFLSSIDRHLRHMNYKHSLINDPEFAKVREVLKSKQKALKKEGYGNKPHQAQALTNEHIEAMYAAKTLGESSPRALLHSLWLICTTHFGMRIGKEIHTLCWGDVSLGIDFETGEEFITFDTERQTKTRTGENPRDIRKVKPRAYAVPEQPDRDPVHLYKLYADKRPVDMMTEDSPFFLTPGNKTQQCWFRKSAMGINKLYSIMTEMKTDAGIQEPRITPYSARKHLIQKLNDENVPAHQIIQISGHRNINSLNNYSSLNKEQSKNISKILSHSNQSVEKHNRTATATASATSSDFPMARGFFVNSHFQGNVTFNFHNSESYMGLSQTQNVVNHQRQSPSRTPAVTADSPVQRHYKRIRLIAESDSD